MPNCSDNEPMPAYSDGCQESFEERFRRCERRARASFLRWEWPDELPRDLHQELFLKPHRFWDADDLEQPVARWLFWTARTR